MDDYKDYTFLGYVLEPRGGHPDSGPNVRPIEPGMMRAALFPSIDAQGNPHAPVGAGEINLRWAVNQMERGGGETVVGLRILGRVWKSKKDSSILFEEV